MGGKTALSRKQQKDACVTTVIRDMAHCFLFSHNSILALVKHCNFHYAVIDCATVVSTNNIKNSVNSLTLFFNPMLQL
jgi:hypothetical protein